MTDTAAASSRVLVVDDDFTITRLVLHVVRAQGFGAARHVRLHVFHVFGGLERNPAGVERYRLADEHDRRPVGIGGPVPPHREEPRRLRRPG